MKDELMKRWHEREDDLTVYVDLAIWGHDIARWIIDIVADAQEIHAREHPLQRDPVKLRPPEVE